MQFRKNTSRETQRIKPSHTLRRANAGTGPQNKLAGGQES